MAGEHTHPDRKNTGSAAVLAMVTTVSSGPRAFFAVAPARGTTFLVDVREGTSQLLGASSTDFENMVGDIVLAQESPVGSSLFRLYWDGTALSAQPIPLSAESFIPGQWEHVTFAGAGIQEIGVPQ